MRQAVMNKPGEIAFRDVPVPAIGAGEALVRVLRIGVCGSDIHVWHGKHPYTSYPVVQGHEVSGRVESVGAGVTNVKPGDLVTLQPQVVCGKCLACRSGRYNICDSLAVMGFQTTGAASERFAVPASKLLALPEPITPDEGAMIEPLAVAVHALGRFGPVKGLKVLVLGAGTIGNLTAQAAKALGASKVMVTDLSDWRLALAKECGADEAVNTAKEDLGAAIARAFGPEKVDLILECVGVADTIDKAVAHARKGSDIVVVGVFGDKPKVDLGLVQDRELRLIGTLMYREEDFPTAIGLVADGKIRLAPLVSDHFPFGDYAKAYAFIESKGDRAMKVLVDV